MTAQRTIGTLVAHTIVVVWLTWPLVTVVATYLPARWGHASIDSLLLAWALAHESRALVGDPFSLPHANAYHPTTHALFYGEAGFGAVPFFAPVFLASGNPTLAVNLTFLIGVVLTAVTLHLVITRWTRSWAAGLLGGWIFLTTHWVLWTWVVVAPNYAILFYLPVIMMLAAEGPGRTGGALGLAGLVALQGLTSAYVAVATMVPLSVLALWRLSRPAGRATGTRLVVALGLASVVPAVAYSGYLTIRAQNPNLHAQTVYGVVRTTRLSLPGGPFAGGLPMAAASPLVLALVAAGLACRLGRRRAPRDDGMSLAWRHGALWAACGTLASLTPVVVWGDHAVVLPQAWLNRVVPIYDTLREPTRLGVVGLLGIAVLAGAALTECARGLGDVGLSRFTRGVVAGVLLGLIGTGLYTRYARGVAWLGLTAPLPREFPLVRRPEMAPALLEHLAASGGPLLEMPIGHPQSHAEAMYRSILHRRPLLNGYSGYWPAAFPARMRVACRLPEPWAVEELRRAMHLESILVHLRGFDRTMVSRQPYACPLSPAHRAAWLAAAGAARADLRLVARVGDDLLFAVRPGP